MANNAIMIVIMAFPRHLRGLHVDRGTDRSRGYNGSMAAGMGPLTLGIVALAAAIAVLYGVIRKK